MADVVDAATRSRMMAGISGKNTQPELLVRKELHHRGLRYVLNGAGLPGRPDVVLPKWKVAVFVHGCFWHWHGCSLSKMPANNRPFWQIKLGANTSRDTVALLSLVSAGWRVATIWECATRGKAAMTNLPVLIDELASWIRNQAESAYLELGAPNSPTSSFAPKHVPTDDTQANRPVRRAGGTRGGVRLPE